jgi:hypothetical protein
MLFHRNKSTEKPSCEIVVDWLGFENARNIKNGERVFNVFEQIRVICLWVVRVYAAEEEEGTESRF